MPIGKDSITKRVAKPTEKAVESKEKNIAPELVATTAAAPTAPKAIGTPAKKATAAKTTTAAKKTGATASKPSTSTKKATPTAKKPAVKTETLVDTAVLGNISPETVKAITGHEENRGFEKTQIGDKMPVHLL
jgi:DNA-binding protein HU-beta